MYKLIENIRKEIPELKTFTDNQINSCYNMDLVDDCI